MIKLTIINKLIISYAISLFAIILISIYLVQTLKDSKSSFDYVVTNSLPSVQELSEAIAHRESARKNTFMLVLAGKNNPELVNKIKNELNQFSKSLSDYEPMVSDQKDKQLLDENASLFANYMKEIDILLGFVASGDIDKAKEMLADNSQLTLVSTQMTNKLDEQVKYNYFLANQYKELTFAKFNDSLIIITILISLAILVVGTIAFMTLRYIKRSLNSFREKLSNISKNLDLTQRVDIIGNDEISNTAQVFNSLIDKFSEVLQELKVISTSVDQAAIEIASSNNDLASRSETQASSLEETAASMNQLSATVKNNVENTREVDQRMLNVNDAVIKTNSDVTELQQTMNEISQASEKIKGFTAVIEGISFQTNILALNAAVEAARAGEHGRGFAVVASEVRSLSHRSSDAAKDIKALVETTVGLINSGVKVTESVVSGMEEASAVVTETMSLIKAVSQASVEQSYGIEQINIAVTEMEAILQQNAAMVEEMSAAAASLKDQSNTLLANVEQFHVEQPSNASWGLNDLVRLPAR